MTVQMTRLRYVKSKDMDRIIEYINMLPYKVERVNAYYSGKDKKHYYVFILPENPMLKEVISGNLD